MKTFRCITTIATLSLLFVNTATFAQDEDPQAGSVKSDRGGTEMVYVPAGTFEFGVQEQQVRSLFEPEMSALELNRLIAAWEITGIMPSVEVEVSGFWIDRYEVSVAQYQPYLYQCLEIGFCREATNDIPETEGNENYPQVGVSWIDALRYCIYRGARLPTEIEWEYAASGPVNLMFPWGNEASVAFELRLYEVGTLDKNVSWIGVYDMAGNAAEWVDELYISRISDREMRGDFGAIRVVRGGSFANGLNANSFSRSDGANVDAREQTTGFRCAQSNDP